MDTTVGVVVLGGHWVESTNLAPPVDPYRYFGTTLACQICQEVPPVFFFVWSTCHSNPFPRLPLSNLSCSALSLLSFSYFSHSHFNISKVLGFPSSSHSLIPHLRALSSLSWPALISIHRLSNSLFCFNTLIQIPSYPQRTIFISQFFCLSMLTDV